ncbi:hypothetical protein G9C98_006423 [Cotesia typhae]|uniref:D-2-hydroxyglutarate dehydrogenase, mitochondrial n=1 Tax=Cotesia typhae TaxID=2053667 RepID=A0A8J5QPV9_9HYME|nr:hypothetical protein G9C98_006423 [Cotesia typhae]
MKPGGLLRKADKIYRLICHGDLARSGSTMPDLTAVRYKVKRGPFGEITGTHVNFFEQLLGHNRVITDPNECDAYNVDWVKTVRGSSRLVLKPKTTDEVKEILKFCNHNRLAVCPQSGNTGLVVLEKHVEQYGLMMPLDLGAKGSCLIGGNISTNAGGQRLLRYGNLHGSVLGLEAVTADGRVIDSISTLKKNNTGYHLKNLFIGSEGTLGVVTKVAIQCPTRPSSQNVAFVGLNSFDKVLKTFVLAREKLAEILSACEVIDSWSMGISTDLLYLKSPLGQKHQFYMLIETSGSNQEHDEDKLMSFFEIRERLGEGCLRDGYCFKYDVSLPLPHFYKLIEALHERLDTSRIVRISGFGHLGDGNLHVIVATPEYDLEIESQLEPFLFEYVSEQRGSVSAEHGIGFKKTKYLSYSKDKSAIQLMKEIKSLMDPNGILNPYKVLP